MSEPFDFEAETDMELLGGTFEDDPKPEEPEIKQDEPAPKEEPKAEDEPKEAPTPDDDEPEEPQPKRDAVIPRARFDEVNAKLHAEREEANRLRAELEALNNPNAAQAAEIDVDTLEDQFFDAIINGEKERAKEIRAQINAEIYTKARAASEEAVSTTLTQREIQSSFAKAVEQTVTDYPFLDSNSPDANAEAIGEVVEWRDFYLSKGDTPAAALQKAAAKIAPIYNKTTEPTPDPTPEPLTDKRKQAAIANAAKASAAQPPAVEAGIGNRAIPFGDDIIGDQAKWDNASEAERQRFLA